jgi:hypothetical protein
LLDTGNRMRRTVEDDLRTTLGPGIRGERPARIESKPGTGVAGLVEYLRRLQPQIGQLIDYGMHEAKRELGSIPSEMRSAARDLSGLPMVLARNPLGSPTAPLAAAYVMGKGVALPAMESVYKLGEPLARETFGRAASESWKMPETVAGVSSLSPALGELAAKQVARGRPLHPGGSKTVEDIATMAAMPQAMGGLSPVGVPAVLSGAAGLTFGAVPFVMGTVPRLEQLVNTLEKSRRFARVGATAPYFDRLRTAYDVMRSSALPSEAGAARSALSKVLERIAVESPELESIAREAKGLLPEVNPALPKRVAGKYGKTEDVLLASGEKIRIRYVLSELDDLVPSHTADEGDIPRFVKHPTFTDPLQNREYDVPSVNAAEVAKVDDHTRRFQPGHLMPGGRTSQGGPAITHPDSEVLGGTSGVIVLRRLRTQGRYHEYTDALGDALQQIDIGIKPEDMEGRAFPVLHRQVIRPPRSIRDLSALSHRLNASISADAPIETDALAGSRLMSEATSAWITASLDEMEAAGSLRNFLGSTKRGRELMERLVDDGVVATESLASYTDPETGGLSENGKSFVEAVILSRVIKNPSAVRALPDIARSKIVASLGALQRIEAVDPRFSMREVIERAADLIREARAADTTVHAHVAGIPLFPGMEPDYAAGNMAKLLVTPPGPKTKGMSLADWRANMAAYTNAVSELVDEAAGQGTLGFGSVSPEDIFERAFGVKSGILSTEPIMGHAERTRLRAQEAAGIVPEAEAALPPAATEIAAPAPEPIAAAAPPEPPPAPAPTKPAPKAEALPKPTKVTVTKTGSSGGSSLYRAKVGTKGEVSYAVKPTQGGVRIFYLDPLGRDLIPVGGGTFPDEKSALRYIRGQAAAHHHAPPRAAGAGIDMGPVEPPAAPRQPEVAAPEPPPQSPVAQLTPAGKAPFQGEEPAWHATKGRKQPEDWVAPPEPSLEPPAWIQEEPPLRSETATPGGPPASPLEAPALPQARLRSSFEIAMDHLEREGKTAWGAVVRGATDPATRATVAQLDEAGASRLMSSERGMMSLMAGGTPEQVAKAAALDGVQMPPRVESPLPPGRPSVGPAVDAVAKAAAENPVKVSHLLEVPEVPGGGGGTPPPGRIDIGGVPPNPGGPLTDQTQSMIRALASRFNWTPRQLSVFMRNTSLQEFGRPVTRYRDLTEHEGRILVQRIAQNPYPGAWSKMKVLEGYQGPRMPLLTNLSPHIYSRAARDVYRVAVNSDIAQAVERDRIWARHERAFRTLSHADVAKINEYAAIPAPADNMAIQMGLTPEMVRIADWQRQLSMVDPARIKPIKGGFIRADKLKMGAFLDAEGSRDPDKMLVIARNLGLDGRLLDTALEHRAMLDEMQDAMEALGLTIPGPGGTRLPISRLRDYYPHVWVDIFGNKITLAEALQSGSLVIKDPRDMVTFTNLWRREGAPDYTLNLEDAFRIYTHGYLRRVYREPAAKYAAAMAKQMAEMPDYRGKWTEIAYIDDWIEQNVLGVPRRRRTLLFEISDPDSEAPELDFGTQEMVAGKRYIAKRRTQAWQQRAARFDEAWFKAFTPARNKIGQWMLKVEGDPLAERFLIPGLAHVGRGMGPRVTRQAADRATRFFYRKLIGFAIDTAIQNSTQGFNDLIGNGTLFRPRELAKSRARGLAATMGNVPLVGRAGVFQRAREAQQTIGASKAVTLSDVLDAYPSFNRFFRMLDNVGFSAFNFTENWNRSGCLFAAYNKAIKKGWSELEAVKFAVEQTNKFHFHYSLLATSPRLASPLMIPMRQFNTFVAKQLELWAYWAANGEVELAKKFWKTAIRGKPYTMSKELILPDTPKNWLGDIEARTRLLQYFIVTGAVAALAGFAGGDIRRYFAKGIVPDPRRWASGKFAPVVASGVDAAKEAATTIGIAMDSPALALQRWRAAVTGQQGVMTVLGDMLRWARLGRLDLAAQVLPYVFEQRGITNMLTDASAWQTGAYEVPFKGIDPKTGREYQAPQVLFRTGKGGVLWKMAGGMPKGAAEEREAMREGTVLEEMRRMTTPPQRPIEETRMTALERSLKHQTKSTREELYRRHPDVVGPALPTKKKKAKKKSYAERSSEQRRRLSK